jgi:hypothetical protein
MKTELRQTIEELLKDCPSGCKCHQNDIENLCKARDLGMKSFIECLEENPFDCNSAISYGHSWYCSCPPRIRIAKELRM